MKKQCFVVALLTVLLSVFVFYPQSARAAPPTPPAVVDSIWFVGPAVPCTGDTVTMYWHTTGAALVQITTASGTTLDIANGHRRVYVSAVGANIFSIRAYSTSTGLFSAPFYDTVYTVPCTAAIDTFTVSDTTACISDSVTFSWHTSTSINCHLYVGSTLYVVPSIGTKKIAVTSTALTTVSLHAMGTSDSAAASLSFRGFHCDSVTSATSCIIPFWSCVGDSISIVVHSTHTTGVVIHTPYGDLHPADNDTVRVGLPGTTNTFVVVYPGPYNTHTDTLHVNAVYCDSVTATLAGVSPALPCIGDTIHLIVHVTNATSIVIHTPSGDVYPTADDTVAVVISGTTNVYTLVAVGPHNTITRVYTHVGVHCYDTAVINSFVVTPAFGCIGHDAGILSWSTSHASSVVLTYSGGTLFLSGSGSMPLPFTVPFDVLTLTAAGPYNTVVQHIGMYGYYCDTVHFTHTIAPDSACLQTPLIISWGTNAAATVTAYTTYGVFYPAATDTMLVLYPPGPDTICLVATGMYNADTSRFSVWVGSCDTGDTVVIDTTLSVAPQSTYYHVSIYPNPSLDYMILASDEELGEIVVTDLVGRTVFSAVFSDKKVSIPTSEWKTGMYFVRVHGQIKKVQKE